MSQNSGKKTNKDNKVDSSVAPVLETSVTPEWVAGVEGETTSVVDAQAQIDAAVAAAVEEIKKQHAAEIDEIKQQADSSVATLLGKLAAAENMLLAQQNENKPITIEMGLSGEAVLNPKFDPDVIAAAESHDVTAPDKEFLVAAHKAAEDGLMWLVQSVPEQFFRCGMRFTREGYVLELTKEQLEILQAEPNLKLTQAFGIEGVE